MSVSTFITLFLYFVNIFFTIVYFFAQKIKKEVNSLWLKTSSELKLYGSLRWNRDANDSLGLSESASFEVLNVALTEEIVNLDL